jgi:hypothetical protein
MSDLCIVNVTNVHQTPIKEVKRLEARGLSQHNPTILTFVTFHPLNNPLQNTLKRSLS